MGIGDWGLGIGDWGLGIGPNPQSPIPNPQSPLIYNNKEIFYNLLIKIKYVYTKIKSKNILKINQQHLPLFFFSFFSIKLLFSFS